jgi:hypothetical protein
VERLPAVSSESESHINGFEDDRATAERAIAAIRIIIGALDAIGEAESLTVTPNATPRMFPLAYGWFAAIVRTGQLIALAHENGLRHECAASARVILQHTLALQWLIEGGDPAVDAVETDGQRRAFDLVKELDDTGWPIPAALTMRPSTRPAKSGAFEHQFDNFKAICALYDGGDQLYVPYRLQSGNAHPSYTGAMAYLVPETGKLSTTAVTDTYAYLIDTTRCVIQAGHAFATLLADTFLATEITRAETTLGIEFALWQRLP